MCTDERLEYIDFEGITYPYIWLDIPNFGIYRVAVMSLADALLDSNNGTYKTEKAEDVDQLFFYYIADDEIYLSEKDIVNSILEGVA